MEFMGYGWVYPMRGKQEAAELVVFRWIVDQLPAAVIITGLDGTIEYVNRHLVETTGYSRDELIGENCRGFALGDRDSRFRDELWNTVVAGRAWQGALETRRKNGRRVSELADILPFRGGDGAVSRVVVVKRDVTEWQVAGERLAEALEGAEEAGRAKTEFLSGISHELRTPLSGISGLIDILIEEAEDTHQLGHLRLLRESTSHLTGVVHQILDSSSAGTTTSEVVESEIDVDEFLRKLLSRFANGAHSRGLELSLRVGRGVPPRVRVDVDKLTRILEHLLDNALTFTSTGGIVLSADTPVPESVYSLELSVADTGVGVPFGDRERVFEPFSRLDSSYARVDGGIGLGLARAKRLVGLLGGTIWVESNPGGGSTFRFTLDTSAPEHETNDFLWDGTPKQVLLAEDNRINELVYRHILEQGGIAVTCASSGNDAVRMMQNELFDAVLLDVEMADLCGTEVIEAIRGFEGKTGRPRQRIVALTAHALRVGNERMLEAGIDGVVTKPVKSAELLASIRSALGSAPDGPVS